MKLSNFADKKFQNNLESFVVGIGIEPMAHRVQTDALPM